MNRPTCETCPFWDRFADASLPDGGGLCRIGRPVSGPVIGWRATNFKDWCGEHPDFQAWIDESKNPPRCTETFSSAQCVHDKGHQGVHEYNLQELPPSRCHNMFRSARCTLEQGHKGSHIHGIIADPMDQPGRCPLFIGGERCGREIGHEGLHVWANGD